jgi:hypothetical protein
MGGKVILVEATEEDAINAQKILDRENALGVRTL